MTSRPDQHWVWLLPLIALALPLAGCTRAHSRLSERPYYMNPGKSIANVSRVAIIEPANLTAHPQVSQSLAAVLAMSLQNQNLFGINLIYRNETAFTSFQLDTEDYTLDQMAALRKGLGCDAIMVGTLRQYHPHPRMAVSLQLRLIDLSDGQLIWAIEDVWDTTDSLTQQRIKKFYEHEMGKGYEPLNWQIGLVSPNAFNKFVSYEISRTLVAATNGAYRQNH